MPVPVPPPLGVCLFVGAMPVPTTLGVPKRQKHISFIFFPHFLATEGEQTRSCVSHGDVL